MNSTAIIVGGTALGSLAIPIIAPFVLSTIGFGAMGPVAGSLAAAQQAGFAGGAAASGSLFSVCQSIAMGGSLAGSALPVAGAIIGAGITTAARAAAAVWR